MQCLIYIIFLIYHLFPFSVFICYDIFDLKEMKSGIHTCSFCVWVRVRKILPRAPNWSLSLTVCISVTSVPPVPPQFTGYLSFIFKDRVYMKQFPVSLSLSVSSWLTSLVVWSMSLQWFGRSMVKLPVRVVWFVLPADPEPSFSPTRKTSRWTSWGVH